MNAERLHAIAVALKKEIDDNETLANLKALVNALQAVAQQSNATTQRNLADALTAFFESVTNVPSDSFTPAWRQILIEMGGAELFGKILKERTEQILAENQLTPIVAHQKMSEILEALHDFEEGLDSTTSGLTQFHVGTEELGEGEAEITLLVPRRAVKDKLRDFADELRQLEFILNTFAEVSTGRKEDLKIRTVSSSDLLVYLSASPVFAACLAKSIDYVIGLYKKLLEVRKLRHEIERLEMPEISEQMKERANRIMSDGIEDVTVKIINQFYVGKDSGRKAELTNSVRICLNRLANRIDKGYNIEVRIQVSDKVTEKVDKKVKAAEAIIQAATPNMQYLKLEGPEILALPETAGAKPPKAKRKGSAKSRTSAGKKDAEPVLPPKDEPKGGN